MITGLNHVTLAVSDLERSLAFYCDLLGAKRRAVWDQGAYLDLGILWLCLEKTDHVDPRNDDSHIAFHTDDFETLAVRITQNAPLWKANKSEGASVYFTDPDGHKLEIHDGTLETRLAHYRETRPDGMTVFEDS